MTSEVIDFNLEEGVAIITLNRPDTLNSFNVELATELQRTLDLCMDNTEVRCVLLTGAGRGFCAGQDLGEAIAPDFGNIEDHVETKFNPLVRKIRAIEKPVVAAVNGVAAGAGANLAFCCDIVVAAESTKFIQSFINIGLIPDTGGTYFLPRLVGLHRATSMMMLGDKITAQEAKQLGLVYKVFPDERLMEEAINLAKRMAKMPTKGIGLIKKSLNYSLRNNLNEQLAVEKDLQAQAGRTSDNAEGITAFLEKRKPVFKGE
ncbi:MAG: 2-(1,2-epoxy-1,2-dihydrophenyl)acetyl-CoA isomerase PaaG [Flavobacteriales bacterium]|nr:2-(1,2-epoxy-1,2-dihydrophenyl)acetyl-CoA isomerase PaaG [Flavobacteriales bacterium]